MANPLESLPSAIHGALKGLFRDATLTRIERGAGDAFDPGPQSRTDYSCKALVEKYSDYLRANSVIDAKDRKILILANSISIRPIANDVLLVGGIRFTVIDVSTDPAEAVWECQGRM